MAFFSLGTFYFSLSCPAQPPPQTVMARTFSIYTIPLIHSSATHTPPQHNDCRNCLFRLQGPGPLTYYTKSHALLTPVMTITVPVVTCQVGRLTARIWRCVGGWVSLCVKTTLALVKIATLALTSFSLRGSL